MLSGEVDEQNFHAHVNYIRRRELNIALSSRKDYSNIVFTKIQTTNCKFNDLNGFLWT